MFEELPDRGELPDYYEIIRRPISLHEITVCDTGPDKRGIPFATLPTYTVGRQRLNMLRASAKAQRPSRCGHSLRARPRSTTESTRP